MAGSHLTAPRSRLCDSSVAQVWLPMFTLLQPACRNPPHPFPPPVQVGPVYHSPERSAPLLEAAYRNSLRVRRGGGENKSSKFTHAVHGVAALALSWPGSLGCPSFPAGPAALGH